MFLYFCCHLIDVGLNAILSIMFWLIGRAAGALTVLPDAAKGAVVRVAVRGEVKVACGPHGSQGHQAHGMPANNPPFAVSICASHFCLSCVDSQSSAHLTFQVPPKVPGRPFVLKLDVVSGSYVGLDHTFRIPIEIEVNEDLRAEQARAQEKKVRD